MIKFTKMHGIGNDYIFISRLKGDNVLLENELPMLARYFSNRNFGIGGDGIILIEESKNADFKMRIFNQDGSEAEMCGNGIRCFAKYIYEKKLIEREEISIETKAGIKYVKLNLKNGMVESVIVDMGEPIFISDKKVILEVVDKIIEVYPISIGNPHAIVFVDDVDNFDVKKYGSAIEINNKFPERTNVEFVQVLGPNYIKMRVWERGAGETFACGTGACASTVVCAILNKTNRNITVLLKGGELKINWKEKNNKIYMSGISTKVFEGEIEEPEF